MKFLKNIVDKLKPTFSEGGKLSMEQHQQKNRFANSRCHRLKTYHDHGCHSLDSGTFIRYV